MHTQIKSISTYQAQQVIDATHFLKLADFPVKIYAFEGNVNSTTGSSYYIQFHGVAAPVSGTTVPLLSVQAVVPASPTGVTPFSFVYPEGIETRNLSNPVGAIITTGGNTLPVYVAISSTDTVYTSVAAATDLRVDINDPSPLIIPNLNVSGDLTTNVSDFTAFATSATTPNRLVSVECINTFGADAWLCLFSYAGPAFPALRPAGAQYIKQWRTQNGVPLFLEFGDGYYIEQIISGVVTNGCYFSTSLTAGSFQPTGSSIGAIRATYL